MDKWKGYVGRIERLKRRKNAIILAHNYQRAEVQDIAEFVGDSLELARKAVDTTSDIIIFCGVDFMAETAAILNPDKRVFIPDTGAICPMAQQLPADDLRVAKRVHPDAEVVLYVNTLAESKVLADCICTSANAQKIVRAMDTSTILFGPDHNLAYHAQKATSKRIIPVPEHGLCPSHHQIVLEDLMNAKEAHPEAKIAVHPECIPEVQDSADYIASTSGMVKICKEVTDTEFLIGTEIGLLHRLKKELPGKKFYPISDTAVCPQMKIHTLAKIEAALEKEKPEVVVKKEIMDKARKPIERMLEISKKAHSVSS
uniref:Quinolinate synthase n=1 Tax=Candidatus Methanophaga sp. ANME-1 ERB7 TaxID=2759913 RepID=A0A7G9Z4K3_9EURY|nr:quinolinate synthase A [Methanosarcinales archaeon ANME-1 ERB7]